MSLHRLAFLSVLAAGSAASAAVSTGARVVSYNPGTLTGAYVYPATSWTAGPAIGLPATTEAGYFGDTSVITPFNAQYNPADFVGLQGAGGSIEFQLSAPVPAAGYTLGVQSGIGLGDTTGNGTTGPAAGDYTSARQATVLVSADGVHFVSLGDRTFTIPTNAYADVSGPFTSTAGGVPADFSRAFTGTLGSFNDETFGQVLNTLDGSGGGDWLNLSGTGLASVDYVELQTGAGETMYVNAVTGTTVVPEPASLAAAAAGLLVLGRRRRRAR